MANLTRMGAGVQRVAQRVLYSAGGQAVMVRMPVAAIAGVLGEQLGLPTAGVSDMELAPVVVRSAGSASETTGEQWELLAGATAVAALAGDETVETALGMFATAVGIVVDGELLRIGGVSYRTVGTAVYLYRLELTGSVNATV